ncbi:MAG: preprotein translocase subunit SecE [Candidatus Pacebacteria bacterium]|nr:preprotein translocase subunit SecE [Candidatus Paceibacterota bacterium]MDD3919318.1 preprotein translocase subunit SecE [Candidatus Paceibacterota bacterium]
MNTKGNFIQDVFMEVKKVTWPSKQELIKNVVNVLVFSLIVAAILGLLDILYIYLLENYFI